MRLRWILLLIVAAAVLASAVLWGAPEVAPNGDATDAGIDQTDPEPSSEETPRTSRKRVRADAPEPATAVARDEELGPPPVEPDPTAAMSLADIEAAERAEMIPMFEIDLRRCEALFKAGVLSEAGLEAAHVRLLLYRSHGPDGWKARAELRELAASFERRVAARFEVGVISQADVDLTVRGARGIALLDRWLDSPLRETRSADAAPPVVPEVDWKSIDHALRHHAKRRLRKLRELITADPEPTGAKLTALRLQSLVALGDLSELTPEGAATRARTILDDSGDAGDGGLEALVGLLEFLAAPPMRDLRKER